MTQFAVINTANGDERVFDTRQEAENTKEEMEGLGMEVEVETRDGGATTPEVIDTADAPDANHAPEYDLDGRSVAEDPLKWVPGDFTDEIDDTIAINRKGFEVLAHFYDIETTVTVDVPPEDGDWEFCRVSATASKPNGTSYEAVGSAHVDRGDDKTLLLEMASTRARKRALAQATGVGAVAVEELKNEVQE